MDGIPEFVLRGGQKVTAGFLVNFRQKIPLVNAKAETLAGLKDFPHLRDQVVFLSRYAEDVLDEAFESGDLTAVPESAFALGYLLQDVDIIPDSVPGKGFADDSAIVRFVLASHAEEFQRYAGASGLSLPPSTP